jgi:hypothetical protein
MTTRGTPLDRWFDEEAEQARVWCKTIKHGKDPLLFLIGCANFTEREHLMHAIKVARAICEGNVEQALIENGATGKLLREWRTKNAIRTTSSTRRKTVPPRTS